MWLRTKAGVQEWLTARPRGQWGSTKGRWVRMVVTTGLVVAGLGTWALAIVQPWTACSGEYGIFATPGELDVAKVRLLSAAAEQLCENRQAEPLSPLKRNPFSLAPSPATVLASAAAAPQTTGKSANAAKATSPLPAGKGSSPAVAAILEKVKSLRLEVTVISPEGERWAVINGQNVQEGEVLADLEVIEIQEGRVKLQQGGITCLLRME